MAKLHDAVASLDPQGQKLYRRLAAKRGHMEMHGVYRILLNHPELTRYVSDLGTFLRFGAGTLPDALRELLILWLARKFTNAYIWVKHEPVAKEAGISPEVIEAMRTHMEPSGLDGLQQAALAAARCVREHRSIPQPLQDELVAALEVKGVLELVVLLGFYEMIAGVIFAFEVPLPEGSADPFG